MTMLPLADAPADGAVPLRLLSPASAAGWLAEQSAERRAWLTQMGFRGEAGQWGVWPGADGAVAGAVAVVGDHVMADVGGLPLALPPASYRLEGAEPAAAQAAALAWAAGGYQFTRYKAASRAPAVLEVPAGADAARVRAVATGLALGRDLINTPANDMGPADLAAAAATLADAFAAQVDVVVGDDLLRQRFPLVHAVGRASAVAPRLIDLRWGDPSARKLTVLGKGVCFDSGGLDLKPSGSMLLMKKDMGGAAHALALAHMVMALQLDVRLRVLVPAVENAVSGAAFRPLDVLPSRRGLTVEIGNTDAEGRLILADALTLAMEEEPDLVLDFATLTGAARVALGPDLPAMFTNRNDLGAAFAAAGDALDDPVWRLPLWGPYAKQLQSRVADLSNTGDSGMAGSILAALFLQRFVEPTVPWVHFDVYGWSPTDRPGRPKGAAIMAVRAALEVIERRLDAPAG